MDPLPTTADGNLAFECPRCHRAVEERFYGPCDACRTELRATMRLDESPRELQDTSFKPKLHVVPNQVALKD